jgi:hypothetical protein
VEESLSDPLRVSLVFSSQGMPYSMGRDALDAMETTYNLIFYTVLEKQTFVEEVRHPIFSALYHVTCFPVTHCATT